MRTIKLWLATIAMLLFSISASAHDFEVNGIYYNILPNVYRSVEVTYEGDSYFSAKYNGNVTIPNSVTYNGFTYSVTAIGEEAFYDCSSLTSMSIPEGVTRIGTRAFYGCSSLTSISIPEGMTRIGFNAFYGCSSLVSIIIPNSVTLIESAAFSGCTGLASISLPSSLTKIWSSTFSGCSNLSSITIPNTVTEIDELAFNSCKALSNILIPNSVKNIGQQAFQYCTNLKEIEIPESVTRINSNVFQNCSALTSVTIPNSVTIIDYHAFENCSKLNNVRIPSSVTKIDAMAFAYCTSLTNINISNAKVTSLSDVFRGCTNLKTIELPISVTSLSGTFYDCTNLTDIVIPSSVTSIGSETFRKCTNLKNVTIPNSVTEIGWAAFDNCNSLTSITIPASVKKIIAWGFSGCYALTEVTCRSSRPATIDDLEFNNLRADSKLYVPKGSKNAYASATGWSNFKNIIEYSLIPEYTITYMVDGEEYYSETIESGAEIPVIDAPAKEGYTFSGWENLPSNMPDEDITVYAKYTPNKYIVTFKAYGEVVSSEMLDYGTTIVAPNAPEVEDYAFVEWANLLETVPAHDVEFVAVYKQVGVRIADDANDFTQEGNRAYDKITYTRTLSNLEWNSLFVPFEILVSDLTDEYDVAYINDIHSYDNDFNGEIDQMEMEVIYIKEGTLHANHPYLIRAKNDEAKEMNIVVTDATLYSSAKADRTSIVCSSAYTDFEVIGTYEKMTAEELDGCYAISTSGAWSPIASGASLNPFRLYMTITSRDGSPVKVSQSAQARINIRVQGEDTETGITETENGNLKTENFDLSGRRVERMQKGIYIVNGKKVVR